MNIGKQESSLTAYQSHLTNEDGISIVNVIFLLLHRKNLILGITAAVVCIGLFYAFSIKRVYQVETIIVPPSVEHIQSLNVLDANVSSTAIFATFIQVVESRKFKKTFFEQNNILNVYTKDWNVKPSIKDVNKIFEGFSKAIKINNDKKTNISKITLDGMNKNKIADWLDTFIEKANQETINQLVKNLELNIALKIKRLKNDILSKRTIYTRKHQDKIIRLEEAYQIAKKLNIREHLFVPKLNGKSTGTISTELNSISNLLASTNNLSMYMNGTKVLQAEINVLKNRDKMSYDIVGLRDLQEKVINLESIIVDKNSLQTVIVDTKASGTEEIVRPNRRLIVMLSFVLGGILAIICVLLMEFRIYMKNRINNRAEIDLV